MEKIAETEFYFRHLFRPVFKLFWACIKIWPYWRHSWLRRHEVSGHLSVLLLCCRLVSAGMCAAYRVSARFACLSFSEGWLKVPTLVALADLYICSFQIILIWCFELNKWYSWCWRWNQLWLVGSPFLMKSGLYGKMSRVGQNYENRTKLREQDKSARTGQNIWAIWGNEKVREQDKSSRTGQKILAIWGNAKVQEQDNRSGEMTRDCTVLYCTVMYCIVSEELVIWLSCRLDVIWVPKMYSIVLYCIVLIN